MLANRYLLLTLEKHARRVVRARGEPLDAGAESDLACIEIIGRSGGFPWARPEHMAPSGGVASLAVRETLREQLARCRESLGLLENGAGGRVLVTMSVADLGKIDLYQWLYFLVQHARRHLAQMERARAEFAEARSRFPPGCL